MARTKLMMVRFTDEELAALARLAKIAKLPISTMARKILLEVIRAVDSDDAGWWISLDFIHPTSFILDKN